MNKCIFQMLNYSFKMNEEMQVSKHLKNQLCKCLSGLENAQYDLVRNTAVFKLENSFLTLKIVV